MKINSYGNSDSAATRTVQIEPVHIQDSRMKPGRNSNFNLAASRKSRKNSRLRMPRKYEAITVHENSVNVQARIKKYLRRDSEVLYLGVEAEKFSCRGYENFFFYPSRIAPGRQRLGAGSAGTWPGL